MATYITNPIISDSFRKSVLKPCGYPTVSEESIYEFYPKDDVDNLVIAECLEKFYNWFPIVEEVDINVGQGVQKFDVPENTLGLVHYTLNKNGSSNINLASGNPFYTSSQVITIGSSRESWGTPFKYGQSQYSQFQKKFYNDSLKNLMGGNQYYCKYLEDEDKVEIKSVSSGIMHIRFGKYSNDVEDIPRRLRVKFLEYCQAYMGLEFSSNILLMNGDLPLEIDADGLKDDSQDKIEVLEEWFNKNSTIPLMR